MAHMLRRAPTLLGGLALFAFTTALQGQEQSTSKSGEATRPTLEARRTPAALVIDGVLDEAAWASADSTLGPFTQSIPDAGEPSALRTVVKVLYDDEFLYVGAKMYDPNPERLISAGLEQDFATGDSDLIGLALDTYWDRQNSFLFALNPAGALFDAQTFNDQQSVNRAWEGVVYTKTTINADGWTAEIAVPFTTLRFVPSEGPQTWGLNFSRRIRRVNEDSSWSPLDRQFRIYKMSRAGTLTGLTGLRGGRNLAVKPFGIARHSGVPGAEEVELETGLDLKWGVTPQLTLDLTALTDFSQVEADAQQINLTRFSQFFPEKRDFFLENEGIFGFQDNRVRNFRTGSGPQNFKLFHSRRIGLSGGRTPVPILGGARLTGRVGPLVLGLLNMQTQNDPDTPGENFSVVRLRKNVLGSSDVGVMFVNREGTGAGIQHQYNRSFGVDGNFRLLEGRMLLNSYFAATQSEESSGDQTTGAVEVAWRDAIWDASFLVKSVGDGFNPGVGFVRRQGIRQGFATVGTHPQPGMNHVRELNPYIDVNVFSDLDWNLESREVKPGIGVGFHDSGLFTLEYSARYENLVETTSIAGVAVAPGEYTFDAISVQYKSDGGRRVSGSVALSKGDFFDGDRESITGSVTVRPSVHWFLGATFQRNKLGLADESFNADLFTGRMRYAGNTRTFLSAFVQYNQATEQMMTNVRFNLIHAPLSDFFLVYSELRDLAGGANAAVLRRALTLKVTKLVAF